MAGRTFDIIVSSLALVFFSPIMLVIAFAILIESGGPILFSQVRLGRGGRHFRMYKFRKFHKECITDGTPLCVEKDKRLTALGKFLRSTKLDELPQLWNIIRGDMSIVGPRPEVLLFKDCFMGEFERVLEYKPGILGPSQVMFRNEGSLFPTDAAPTEFYRQVLFPIKARLDLAYYQRRTVWSDIVWLLRGVLAVLGWAPVNDKSPRRAAGIARHRHSRGAEQPRGHQP